MPIPLQDIVPYHAALLQGGSPSGNPEGTLATLVVLLLLLLSAVALLLLGIALLAWLLRPSDAEVDVVPLQTVKDVFWVAVSKGKRPSAGPQDRKADERESSRR